MSLVLTNKCPVLSNLDIKESHTGLREPLTLCKDYYGETKYKVKTKVKTLQKIRNPEPRIPELIQADTPETNIVIGAGRIAPHAFRRAGIAIKVVPRTAPQHF